MNLSFITPTKYIADFGSQSDFILALSHLIDLNYENEYEKAIKATGLPIYLDNGLFENKTPENVVDLLTKANKVGAEIVFAPDHLYDMQKTKDEIDKCWELFQLAGVKMAAVVQADNVKDWLSLYDDFVQDERITMIGLSILSIPKCWGKSIVGSRKSCLMELAKRPSKRCHMLGAGEGYEDMIYAQQHCSFVESHDSSSAFWNAMQGKRLVELATGSIRVEGGKTTVPVDFDFDSADQDQLDRAQQNINLLKQRLCK